MTAEYPRPRLAKQVATRLHRTPDYMRHVLASMVKKGEIVHRPGAGYSVGDAPRVADADLRLENVFLVARAPQSHIAPIRSALGVTPAHGRNKAFASEEWFERWFRSWPVTFKLFPNGTLTLRLHADGGVGLSYLEATQFAGWLEGVLEILPLKAWEVRKYEFHKDLAHVRLEGAKALTLNLFLDAWLKVYQKADRLRIEGVHMVSVPVSEFMATVARIAEEFAARGLVVVREVQPAAAYRRPYP